MIRWLTGGRAMTPSVVLPLAASGQPRSRRWPGGRILLVLAVFLAVGWLVLTE